MEKTKKYPIKVVSKKTGISLHVIRAWEKRYQAVIPERTETNRRLYSEDDIYKLQLLKVATRNGYSIGNIAGLSISELESLVDMTVQQESTSEEHQAANPDRSAPATYLNRCLNSIFNFDANQLEYHLQQAAVALSQPLLIDQVLKPLIEQIGALWHDGKIRVMHEHMATAIITNFISNLRKNYRHSPGAPAIVITTPLGQVHEIGAQLAALIAAGAGWVPVYLGASIPAEEIAAAVQISGSRAVGLSIVYPDEDPFIREEIEKLRRLLPQRVTIILGGRMAMHYGAKYKTDGVRVISDLDEFRKFLHQIIG